MTEPRDDAGMRDAGETPLSLPPDLERFLPANLWHRLTADPPRRGVLLTALDRVRSILYLVSTYLPAHLVQEKMRRPVPGLVRGRMSSGSLLFVDVSGFTALSEQLASLRDGAEQLTGLMNQYFERMLEILSRSGGILLKFAGDALLAWFPEQKGGEQARRAARAAQRMMAAIGDFSAMTTPGRTVELRMKIGIGTGRFVAASVGTAERMEYVILGETVTRTLAAEGQAQAGEIVADAMTAAHLHSACCIKSGEGFFALVRETGEVLDDYEIRIEPRRARGAIPWSASPHAIAAQMEIPLRQIRALTPFLPPDLVERIVGSALQRQVESEHRPATVLFVNLTGLEPLLSTRGKEGVQRVTRLLDEYFRAMQSVVAQHGGIISRVDPYSQGSKMLLLFGAPVTHEDQPLRAVSAALAMNDELAALNARWRRQLRDGDKPLIEQRMGITRGQAFAGQVGSVTRREYTVMGDDVNLAARLMAAAQPGQILLSQRVYEAVADHYSATALGEIRVKGKGQPIPIYLPTGHRDDPLARRLQQRGCLVGREPELEVGQAAIRRLSGGQGGSLRIDGPAGVGKSRLADELAAYALARGVVVVFSACRSYAADAAYAPWVTLLQSLLGTVSGREPDGPYSSERLLQALDDLELPAEKYADPLANLLGLPRIFASPRPASAQEAPVQAQPADGQRKPPRTAAVFSRLEQQVARENEGKLDLWRLVRERPFADAQQAPQGTGRGAQPGQVWHSLQRRVASRQQERLFAAVRGLLHRIAARAPVLLLLENAQWMDPASRTLLDFLGKDLQRLPILTLVVRRGEGEPVLPALGASEVGMVVAEAPTRSAEEQKLVLGPLEWAGTAALADHLLGEKVQTDLATAIHQLSGGNPLFVEEILHWLQRTGQSVPGALGDGLRASTTVQELVLSRLDSLPSEQRDTIKAASVVGGEFLDGQIGALLPASTDTERLGDHLDGLEGARLILLIQSEPDVRYAFRQTLVQEVVYGSQSFARRRELHARLAAYLETADAASTAQQAELLAHHYELAERPLPAAQYLLLSAEKARQRHAYPQAADYYRRTLAILAPVPPREAAQAQERDTELMTLEAGAHEGLGDMAVLAGDFPAAAAEYKAAAAEYQAAAAEYQAARARPGDGIPGNLLIKLAQVLPTQDQGSVAEVYARQAWAIHDADSELVAAATMSWLLWRSGHAEASDWIARGRQLAARRTWPWCDDMDAILADMAGDWSQAQQAYLALDQPAGAALVACRQGDRLLQDGETAGALAFYRQAAGWWEGESDACGLALARYCQARAYLQTGDVSACRDALREALSLMETAQTAICKDQPSIRQALRALEAGRAVSWSPQRWQEYDDAFRISMLFRPWSQ